MTLNGRFEYKKALLLTPERIRELESIFLKYSKKVSYEATTVADTEISFESVNELLDYDNFQNHKLKSLTIIGLDGLERVVICVFEADGIKTFVRYSETCVCRYTVSDVNIETILKEEVLTFLKKITEPFWLIGKIRLFRISFIVSLLAFLFLVLSTSRSDIELSSTALIVSTLVAFCIVEAIRFLDRCILENLFPPIVFLWGEEKVRYEKCDNRRKNLFWGVLVSIFVGIVVFYITNNLPK